eukprot:2961806-Prymnesium_polylepis.1
MVVYMVVVALVAVVMVEGRAAERVEGEREVVQLVEEMEVVSKGLARAAGMSVEVLKELVGQQEVNTEVTMEAAVKEVVAVVVDRVARM